MNAEILNILKEASEKGVKIGLKDNSLTIKSATPIDSDLLQKIKENKALIIKYIEKRKAKNKKNKLTKVTPCDLNSITEIPLSFGQERLWFLDKLKGSLEYHMPVILRLKGALDISFLETSFCKIIDRHEVLRTNICSKDGIGYQEIMSCDNWILENKILDDNDSLEEAISSFIEIPFDLSKDYKLRVCLYNLGNDQYVLACVFHHIASDGWSEGILVNEFTELYSALQSGHSAILPELSLQYKDYAVWQRNYLEGKVLESQLSYWEEKLKGVSTLSLQTDYVRPSLQSTVGASIYFQLDKKLSVSIASLCKQEGVTTFMFLLSTFKILLSRYSGQNDICVGTPIANRTQSELEGMIGFFINTLALRSDLSGNPSFIELLKQVKDTTLGGYDNQLAPFEKVVNRVVVERDMNITPLFQVMFDLQSTPEESKETAEGLGGLEGITISEYEFDTVTSKFDLALHASENDAGIILDMEYCTALFDSSTIDRMLLHYQELLFSIVKDITQPIGDLSMLTSSEEIQLFESFNRTLVTYPKNKTIVDLFSDQASRTPNAIAVVFKGMELSYEELDKRSNQLGHYLREKGVKPDDLVGICLERSLEMLIGILGILKSGAAYVPIDPDYPKDRIDYTLDDAGINIVLSSAYGSRVLKNNKDLIILLLDGDCDVIGGFSENGLSNVSSPSDLAYVIYTSGSTGKPKGVLITHTNVVRLFYNDSCLFDFSSQDVWTLFHSFCFDFSVWEMYGALLHGGRLVVVPKEVTKNAISFKDLLINEGVTVLNQTPSSFYALQEEFLSGSSNHSLRYVIFGGEALNPSYLARWKEFYPDCRLINMYGITETTVHVTYKEITVVDTLSSKSTIGSAIPTLECYIVDDYLNLVPIGVVGELCIGGAGVARGYLNRGELTQEKFIDNPFSSDSKSRLYRSGDLGKWLADGGIEYLGRKDDQVKIRGYRIELGEIEHALSKLAGIQSSCVLAREDVNGNKRLIGYIVVEGEFDKESIQEELKLSLPDYMVPQLWVELDEMPLTSNGKLNKKSLPEPDSSDLSTQVYVAPRNETELQLVKIWKELLGVEQIGIYDNFFELGGDSIISIRLISKINETFDKHIQLRDLFNYSNIQGFSDSVLNVDTYDGTYDLLYKDVESKISVLCSSILNSREDSDLIEDIYPMSDVQQGMVMESLIDPSLAVFHDQMLFPFQDSSFDFEIFHKSILVLIEKHSIFRTQFNFSDYNQPVQIVHKVVSFDIKHTDLSILDKQTQEKRIEEFLMLERKISFQVQEGSLYRFHIFTIDAYNKVIVFQFHHAILDGWSVASFATELYKTYFKLKKENNYLPSKIDCSQRDFIIKEQMAKQDTTAISFWKEELSGYKNLEIFSEETEKTVNYVRQYDISFLHSIQEQCKVSNVTLKTVFFGAYIYALQMFTHEAELTVGLVSNNRPLVKDGDKVLGCFLNTLPVRYLFKSEGSWDSYFQDIEEKLKEVQLYGHLTFFEIKRLIGMNNDESLFDTLFNYIDFHVYNDINKQNFSINDSSDEDTDVTDDLDISSFERTNSSLNLTVNLTGGTGVEFQYALHKDFKSEVSLERFHSYVDNILSYFCEKPKTSVRMDLILSENESDQLTGTFNSTELAYPEDKTLVELFVD
ncbi:non-ribosomal peptide synthetase, partial [Aquimarina muelleri]